MRFRRSSLILFPHFYCLVGFARHKSCASYVVGQRVDTSLTIQWTCKHQLLVERVAKGREEKHTRRYKHLVAQQFELAGNCGHSSNPRTTSSRYHLWKQNASKETAIKIKIFTSSKWSHGGEHKRNWMKSQTKTSFFSGKPHSFVYVRSPDLCFIESFHIMVSIIWK